jgi:hypothetical protein
MWKEGDDRKTLHRQSQSACFHNQDAPLLLSISPLPQYTPLEPLSTPGSDRSSAFSISKKHRFTFD